jgi:hypothetical protein
MKPRWSLLSLLAVAALAAVLADRPAAVSPTGASETPPPTALSSKSVVGPSRHAWLDVPRAAWRWMRNVSAGAGV